MIDEIGNVAHYSSLKNLANILHDKQIKLGTVANLADPRESSLSWIESVGISSELCSEDLHKVHDSTNELIKSVGNRLRIFCAITTEDKHQQAACYQIESSIYGRPRMWSQYGENSIGFCVVLNQNQLSQEMEALAEKPNHILFGKVSYYDWLHLVQGGVEIEYGTVAMSSEKNLFEKINENEMLRSIYFKKSLDWKHENEYRWLLFSESKETYVSIENAVKAVVLGCKFPRNQVSQARAYCEDLGCFCYLLEYQHPQYQLHQI